MNRFNGEAWDLLDPWLDLAPIVGMDFYHYKRDFWFHGYANYILPYHIGMLQEKKILVTYIVTVGDLEAIIII